MDIGKAKKEMNMKVNILMIKNAVKESSHGNLEIYIQGNFLMILEMVREKWNGLMDHIIKVNGWKEFKMVKESCLEKENWFKDRFWIIEL